ncbi:MAG: cellulose-binding domain-containing protein, partial [Chloroflexi bacterium]|nr:cellulose-binding domain-containing protein [Chloroflexota bacterium]
FITEWGWQQGGATPTSGTRSGYGVPFSAYLDSKGVSWTAWTFDIYWQPVMFDTSWNLLGGENYMGQFTKDLLYQRRNDNLPGGGTGPTPTTPPTTPTRTPIGPTATPVRTPTPTPGTGGSCAVTYAISDNWGSGFNANVTIKNNSATAISGWTLAWTFGSSQQITNLWNGSYTQSGQNVTVTNVSYNNVIGANGGTVSFGFSANGSSARPASFRLNGTTCSVS